MNITFWYHPSSCTSGEDRKVKKMPKNGQQELNAKEIGARIAQSRREAGGMTQRELADLIGVTERSVAAYEAGDVVPYRFMRKIEDILAKPAAWILYGEEATPSHMEDRLTALERKIDRILELLDK